MKSLTIIYPKTDEMAVEEVPAIVTNRKNVVIFKNKIVEIEDFVDDLINGYDMTINFLINNKENFINTILFDMQENSKFRIVLRHTQVYSKYLSAALHPDYLSDVEKRKELFQRLQINCKEEFENKRVLEEVHELLYGSVPYFMFDFYHYSVFRTYLTSTRLDAAASSFPSPSRIRLFAPLPTTSIAFVSFG